MQDLPAATNQVSSAQRKLWGIKQVVKISSTSLGNTAACNTSSVKLGRQMCGQHILLSPGFTCEADGAVEVQMERQICLLPITSTASKCRKVTSVSCLGLFRLTYLFFRSCHLLSLQQTSPPPLSVFSESPASHQPSTQKPKEKSCPQYPYQCREIPWATGHPCTNSPPPDRPGQ